MDSHLGGQDQVNTDLRGRYRFLASSDTQATIIARSEIAGTEPGVCRPPHCFW